MRRLIGLLPALLAATAISACGADDEQPAEPSRPATTQLRVEVTGAGPDPVRVGLTCGGSEPCDRSRLHKLSGIVKRDDAKQACTQQYGGPERARVTGTLEGEPVDITVTRENGCEIADYQALFAALGRKPPLAN
jgi:hypothetical protein